MKNKALFSKITLASTVALLATGVVAPSIGAKVTFADDTAITEKDKVLTPAEISAMYKAEEAVISEYLTKRNELVTQLERTDLSEEQRKNLEREFEEVRTKLNKANSDRPSTNAASKYADQFFAKNDWRHVLVFELVL